MSDAEKQARLAEALRANLRKRKAQAREAATGGEAAVRSEPLASETSDDDRES